MYHHKSFVQDIGTMALIKSGDIKVHTGEVRRFVADGVEFEGEQGGTEKFDVVVCATGYKHTAHESYLGADVTKASLNQYGFVTSGEESKAAPGLYYVGFNDKMGRLAEINLETERIGNELARKYKS